MSEQPESTVAAPAPVAAPSVETRVEQAVEKIEQVAVADFKALVARVEKLESQAVSEAKVLEGKVKAALTHIGVDVKQFFKGL